MKKRIALLLLPLAAQLYLPCCVSCTEPNSEPIDIPEPEQEPQKPEKPGAGNYTVVFPEQTGVDKTGWEEGDQIYFHGNYGPHAQTVTLKAADITDGGKKATVALTESLMELQCAPDGIYAVYPAQAVKEYDSLMDSDVEFTQWDRLLMMAYLKDGSFAFRSVTAAFSFTVSGDFDSYALCGIDRAGIRVAGFRADYTSQVQNIDSFINDGYPFREGAVTAGGATTLILPGGLNFKKGFTLFLGKDGVFPKVYTHEAVNIVPGEKLDLGDITAALADYDGPAPKMPEMGKVTKYSVKFNELSGLCVDSSAEFLWILGDGGEIGRLSITGELLNSVGLRTTSGSTLDSEGISVNYDTGDLLISCEPNAFCRIPYESIPHIFDSKPFKGVVAQFNIADAKNFGNAGAEGCTYYKDGLVYIGTQTGSYLYLCNLETGEVLWRKGLRQMFPVITEIAGLSYDPLTDWLWVIDSESHKFFALTGDAEQLLGAYSLTTRSNEESICVDHVNSCVWVGDDYGSTSYVYKYDFTGLDDAIIAIR